MFQVRVLVRPLLRYLGKTSVDTASPPLRLPNRHYRPMSIFTESRPGTYILYLRLAEPRHLSIGQLGSFDFPAGWYAYVGSAFGTGGLRGRIQHHLRPVKHPHWHIDSLRAAAPCEHIWFYAGQMPHEHAWAAILETTAGATIPAPRFGASDCKCASHLFHFVTYPNLDEFRGRTGCKVLVWTVSRRESGSGRPM